MNLFHRWYCRSERWARAMRQYLPLMLDGIDLGDHVLEIGPGPGVTTDWLRERVPRLTALGVGGEILASNVVRELVAGKGFLFSDCGHIALKGFEDPARLYRARWRES